MRPKPPKNPGTPPDPQPVSSEKAPPSLGGRSVELGAMPPPPTAPLNANHPFPNGSPCSMSSNTVIGEKTGPPEVNESWSKSTSTVVPGPPWTPPMTITTSSRLPLKVPSPPVPRLTKLLRGALTSTHWSSNSVLVNVVSSRNESSAPSVQPSPLRSSRMVISSVY